MKLTFDPDLNVAYLQVRENPTVEVQTIQVSNELNVDLDKDGQVYGLEFMNARILFGAASQLVLPTNINSIN